SASSSSLPYSVRVLACVATAPTPTRTQGTPFPTHGTRVVTAAPTSPVRGSIAAIENVWKTSESRHSMGTWVCAVRLAKTAMTSVAARNLFGVLGVRMLDRTDEG